MTELVSVLSSEGNHPTTLFPPQNSYFVLLTNYSTSLEAMATLSNHWSNTCFLNIAEGIHQQISGTFNLSSKISWPMLIFIVHLSTHVLANSQALKFDTVWANLDFVLIQFVTAFTNKTQNIWYLRLLIDYIIGTIWSYLMVFVSIKSSWNHHFAPLFTSNHHSRRGFGWNKIILVNFTLWFAVELILGQKLPKLFGGCKSLKWPIFGQFLTCIYCKWPMSSH